MRTLPALVHVRAGAREGDRPVDEVSARTMNVDALRRDLQGGALPRDTEVLFTGISDWTPAHAIPELWVAGPAQTVVEDEEPASSVGESSRRSVAPDAGRRRKSFGALAWVGAVFGALALLATGLGAVYLVYFHYKPVAVQHLPRKCTVAVRVDLVDTYRFDPAKNGLPPLVNSLLRGPPKPPPPGPQPPEPPPLPERLKVQAGIDLGMGHVREFAVCVYQDHKAPSKDPFLGFRAVVAVGGKIKGGVIPGLFEALRTEARSPRLACGSTASARPRSSAASSPAWTSSWARPTTARSSSPSRTRRSPLRASCAPKKTPRPPPACSTRARSRSPRATTRSVSSVS
ncbi:MAG: hypothetical protein IPJ34_27060 [Myxococcales bacterium]|nr:hypothetical protein [Myxococcales bacterium]